MMNSQIEDQYAEHIEYRDTALIDYQHEFLHADDPWLLGDGGRGSGKSFVLCCKIFDRASAHPNAREGLYRQKLIDLRTTTLKTLLEGDGMNPPVLLPGSYTHNSTLKCIKLNTGGEIVYNGMDQGDVGREAGSTGKGSSSNLTGAAFDEWVEIQENAMVQVCGGVRVKLPGLPLQRYGVCNPSTPMHPLAVRFGITDPSTKHPNARRIQMPAKDNFFNPPEYLEDLALLTGVARMRYWDGLWVGADGLVYDRFLRSHHVRDWERPERFEKGQIIGVDDGYTDPFVVLDYGIDPDGMLWCRNEVYESKLTQVEKIERVKSLWRGDCPVVVDNAAPDLIESMKRAGINAVACDKGQGSVNYGIGVVQTLLAKEGQGGDPWLSYSPNCTNTIREKESYEWKPGISGVKDQPRDTNNHSCFPAGTMVTTQDGDVPIEQIKPGDMVATPNGFEAVSSCGMTAIDAQLVEIETEAGVVLRCTPDHPIYIQGMGMIPADAVRYSDTLVVCQVLNMPVEVGHETPKGITAGGLLREEPSNYCIEGYTPTKSGQSQPDTTSTTLTGTKRTTIRPIWKRSHRAIIFENTPTASKKQCLWQEGGTGQSKAGRGIRNMQAKRSKTGSMNASVGIAAPISSAEVPFESPDSAETTVKPRPEEHPALIMSIVLAPPVGAGSKRTNIRRHAIALDRVQIVRRLPERADVYNLTVSPTHAYFANGVLVSNCDAERYALRYITEERGGRVLSSGISEESSNSKLSFEDARKDADWGW